MPQKICPDNASNDNQKFYCAKCDYGCNKLFLFKQHCNTKKHLKTECSKMLTKHAQTYECPCGRTYKHVQSYNRHQKTCQHAQMHQPRSSDKEKEELRGMIATLITQNQNMLLENKEMR